MTKLNRIILIIIGLLLIVVVLFFAIWTRPAGKKTAPTNQQMGAARVGAPVAEGLAVKKIEQRQATPEEIATREVTVLSQTFAERFGTYSNDGNFQNIIDLYPQMTSLMADWAKDYVLKMRSQANKDGYEGATTRAISVSLNSLNLDGGKAETMVKTQRSEVKPGQPEPRVYYQDLRLELVKVGADWKVDGAYWVK